MKKFVIEGGRPLKGKVAISGSKNACLPIMAATLLAPGEYIIHNVPILGDIRTMMKILEVIGAKTKLKDHTLIVDTKVVTNPDAPYELVSTMRASFLVTGALISRLGKARVARPGGCAIGPRPIDEHLRGFRALGVKIDEKHGYINANVESLKGAKIYLNERSVTATENILLASVMAEGETYIINAAREPHVMELIKFLNLMGAKIRYKDDVITVDGVSKLHSTEYRVSPDYNEAGTFMIAVAITGGDVFLQDARWEDSISEISKLQEIGCEIKSETNGIRVKRRDTLKPCDIKTAPYPGFPTDLQPQITSLLTIADGISIVTETMYENRFNHIPELKRMGAKIELDERSAIINGVSNLFGAKVMASDIRAGAALVIAGLAGEGITEVSRVYHIDRGYEKLETKLSSIGAEIKRV
ncbi:MAG: UDP-N-acetylglucosamine 1-carboxyvinyltransferase [bacterium]|nr:UDP-N-acetylglucosamine 1-carboxyvinyltransferase [bacterium]